jgi:hypothetical protein
MEDKKIFLGSLEITNNILKNRLCNSLDEDGKAYIRDEYSIDKNIIIKRIGKNILTGNEEWRYDQDTKTYAYFQENKFNEDGLGKFDTMMCTHFRWQPYSIEIEESKFQGSSNGEIMFNFYNDSKGLDYFKKWLKEQFLKGKPIEVYFALQFPILIEKEKIYNWCYLNRLNREYSDISVTSSEGLQPILNKSNQRRITRRK